MRLSRVGVIGTGFIARGVARSIQRTPDLELGPVLTRRPAASVDGFDAARFTREVDELIAGSDLVVEACGDAVHATAVLCAVQEAGLPIVTMDSELQVTTGTYFARRGYITEADGDQPGCLARLHEEAVGMGFVPRAYINLKGFLNPTPELEEMLYWSKKQGLRPEQVVSFTDGSKLHVEQALVANGLGADIVHEGLLGPTIEDLYDVDFLIEHGRAAASGAVSDFVLCKGTPPGVMIVAEHEDAAALGDYGPTARIRTAGGTGFVLLRPYHLCHLEVVRSLRAVVAGAAPLLNNGRQPHVGVAAVAKRALPAGHLLPRGIGSFDLRGYAVRMRDHADHVPLCLIQESRLRRAVEPGQVLTFDDVELPATRALEIYLALREEMDASLAMQEAR